MFYDKVLGQLSEHEGVKGYPYRCSQGFMTIGIGRNLEARPLSQDEIRYLFNNDLNAVMQDMESIFGNDFAFFSQNRRLALTDMRFNLGYGGFRTFKKMIAAIKAGDWEQAANEAIDSAWATQVQPSRVNTVEAQLRNG